MNPEVSPASGDANEEIAALIEMLHQTERRLEALTAGEVDTVTDREGRTILLRRAQEQLRHSDAARQAAILDALPAQIALLDTQGLIISVNDAWRRFATENRFHGQAYAIGLNYLDICDRAQGNDAFEAREAAEGIRSVLSGGRKNFSLEYPCHSPTEERWFLMMVTPLAGDPPHGAVVMHLNITARRVAEAVRASLEAQLRESQKMEVIGTLAGGIAHDFNNILATILGNTELARQDLNSSPMALESLAEIHKAASRARDLVQQILSFSRRQPTELKRTALAPIVEKSARLLRATLPARLVLEVHCDNDVPAVLADATQMQQIVINLVTNAMQAMHSGPGRIGIRLDTVLLDAAPSAAHPALRDLQARHPGRMVRLAVSDEGPGMDAGTLARIFEPFFTTKAVDEGTGLGLSVVHGIVQGHEGAIVVDSQPGSGATFTVYLPAADAQSVTPALVERAAANSPSPIVGSDQHILYLDDDESLVFLVTRLLERRGYRISSYTDQRQALDALRADPASFDLVVTDYNMPGMSGLDVAREVRAIRTDLPVAIASGFIDEALRTQSDDAGVHELIFKASAAEDLCDAFARLARTVAATAKSS